MNVYFKFLLILSISLNFTGCSKNVEKDALGNSIEQTKTSTVQNPEELGKELFEGKGTCASCHQANAKVIGPSITEISKKYKENNSSIALFLKGEGDPLVDPGQYEIMKANFAITKTMTDEELDAIEAYMHSVK